MLLAEPSKRHLDVTLVNAQKIEQKKKVPKQRMFQSLHFIELGLISKLRNIMDLKVTSLHAFICIFITK